MTSNLKYNVQGEDRKRLVRAISEILEINPKYMGVATQNYQVGSFTIDRNGMISFDDNANAGEVKNLMEKLKTKGFEYEGDGLQVEEQPDEDTPVEESEENEKSEHGASVGLTVAVPLDKVSVGNLTRLLDAKGNLIKKALGINATPIEISEDAVSFPWFQEMPDTDTVQAYTHFISALCRMSKDQKRITATEKNVENEKYAFRCFLLRLGFIGSEYKLERKILLKNLTGSAAFKSVPEQATNNDKGGVDHAIS